jgi:hypothetical protein
MKGLVGERVETNHLNRLERFGRFEQQKHDFSCAF